MTWSRRRWNSDSGEPTWVAWIPLVVLIAVSLMATVLLSWNSVFDLAGQCIEIASFHDPERARFEFSPWLMPYFKTADDVRPRLRDEVPLLVSGRHRYFVAYRLRPKVCFLDEPEVVKHLQEEGVDFVRVGDLRTRGPAGVDGDHDAAPLFLADFEDGCLLNWSKGTTVSSRDRQ